MKKGETLYFADTDMDRVVGVLFRHTQTEILLEENPNLHLNEKTKQAMDSIFYVDIPTEGTMFISENYLFKTVSEAEEKLSKFKTEIYNSFIEKDGWIREIIKTYNNGTTAYNKEMFKKLLNNDKEKVINEFMIPWFEENFEAEIVTSIMAKVILSETNIDIDEHL